MTRLEPALPRMEPTDRIPAPADDSDALTLNRLWQYVDAVTASLSSTVSLIASENLPTTTVRELLADGILAAKTAEGDPGRRFHAGCDAADAVETYALNALRRLYGTESANVQVMTASIANLAVIDAALHGVQRPRILAFDIRSGGHISHRHARAETRYYSVDRETGRLDYAALRALAREFAPTLIIAGSSAYPRQIDFATVAAIAREVGAVFHADISHVAGLIAAGLHPSPVPYADLVTGSTYKTLCGPRSGFILGGGDRDETPLWRAVNRNVFPRLQSSPNLAQIAAKAACFVEAGKSTFRAYASEVIANCQVLAAELQRLGWPVVTGGTDTHMLLVDVSARGLTGRVAQDALESVSLICNRNLIPFDPQPPQITSGLRLGSAQVTARGGHADTMRELAVLIDRTLAAVKPLDSQRYTLATDVQRAVQATVRAIAADGLNGLAVPFRFATAWPPVS